jgi:hypothetical protein
MARMDTNIIGGRMGVGFRVLLAPTMILVPTGIVGTHTMTVPVGFRIIAARQTPPAPAQPAMAE